MKLAAAAILSLVATATYASPVAYSENQVSAQYSAADAPVTVHLEKRTGKQLGFMERISEDQGLSKSQPPSARTRLTTRTDSPKK
ncbi:hypothetical protein BASA62_007833 [Batrachochytrium salamandrivorans]|nr:hypothetical protein BASA62_007833 [Batrachochytrium salamandrivorans]